MTRAPHRPFRGLLAAAALALAAAAQASPTNHQSPLGINIRDVKYWGTEIPTVDLFRKAGANGRLWQTQSDAIFNTNEHALLDLDPQGWPRSLPEPGAAVQYRYVTTFLFAGTSRFPGGRHTVLYDGEGTLGYGGAGTRNAALSQPGADVVDVNPAAGNFFLSIRATDPNRTGNHLRNIRVIPPGGTCDFDVRAYTPDGAECPGTFRPFTQTYVTEPFHPLFLNDVMRFSAVRFIHFTGTNTTMVENWDQRVRPDVASWGGQATDGAPYEAAIALANTLDAAPWFNVPARANDDYIRRFAELVKAGLTTARPVYVEYNNETWNGAYPYSLHALWMQANGVARWPASPLDPFGKQMNWFGMRTAEACAIWKQVFADQPGRVQCVMGTQLPNTGASTAALDCPLAVAEGRPACHANMDALAIGSYFGDHIAQARFEPVWREWFAQPDGGLQRLFDEVYTGLIPRSGNPAVPMGALQAIRNALQQQGAIATARGLQLVAYEAGSGFDAALRAPGDPLEASYQQLQALMTAGSRDRRMEAAFRQMLEDWRAAGGDLLMAFSSAQAWSPVSGNAAMLEYEGQSRSLAPKYDAALNFLAAHACGWAGCDAGNAGIATATTVVASAPSVAAGAPVTLTATVAGGAARGVVSFTADGLSITGCEAVAVASGASGRVATCTTSALAAGNRAIVAAYSGDSTNRRSTSPAYPLVVTDGGVLDPAGDADGDGIPNGVEGAEGRNAFAKDNDVFASARLFAMQQYRDFLSREGDAGGIAYWTGQVQGGAQSRAQAIQGFLASPEFQGVIAPVARLYFATFLRVPDYAGLQYHAARSRAGTPLAAIASDFATSPEFAARYGALSDAQFVALVYRNVLGRDPDAGGLAFWTGQLASGASRGQVMTGFSESPEFVAAIAPEVFVTMTYAGMLRRAPDAGGFAYWVGALDGGQSGLALTDGFLGSPEYRARFLP